MTETMTIPLNKLLAWEGNVRKTDPDKGIDELTASIAAHGLLQSLVVRKDKRGKYAVVAGRRRLLALKFLRDAGTIDAHRAVPCTVLDDDADATEISLAENVLREPMHPADEFDAFKDLIHKSVPIADVAARFGVTETVVQKRLKLARVSPTLLAPYREGDMTLQHVMAFAVTDDHAEQERIWNELPEWRKTDPNAIRDTLSDHEITAADRRVKFVTLKAYEKAGGTTRRDLFSEGKDGVFIDDVVILESLVATNLERTANRLRKEGWKWVEIRSSFDHDEWSKCQRRYPEPVPLSAEEAAELHGLQAEHDTLWEIEQPDDEQQARVDAITERIDALENGLTTWPAETLAIAGAVVTLGHDGEASIQAGLVRPEDAPEKLFKRKSTSEDGGGGGVAFSASLIESMPPHRSAALNAALLERPDVALPATVHAMALQVFYSGFPDDERGDSVLQIGASAEWLDRVEGSRASETTAAAGEQWAGRIPGNPADLFAWCLALDGDTVRELLAYCVAQTVNAVLLKAGPTAAAWSMPPFWPMPKLDMAAWFQATAANYFGKISKAQIIDALREVKGAVAPAWSGMKKAELAALAEREIAGTGWLPEPLRAPAPGTAAAA